MNKLVIIALFACTISSHAFGQYQIPDSIANKVAHGIDNNPVSRYQNRTKDNRWEGLYTRKIASSTFSVLSFTRGKITFSSNTSSPITIATARYPFVWVTALNDGRTENQLSYRMDIVADSGKSLNLSPSVINMYHLTAADLFFVGFKYQPGTVPNTRNHVYVPLSVGNNHPDANMYLTVKSNSALDHVRAIITDHSNNTVDTVAPLIDKYYEHEELINFTIPCSHFENGHQYEILLTGTFDKTEITKPFEFCYLTY